LSYDHQPAGILVFSGGRVKFWGGSRFEARLHVGNRPAVRLGKLNF